MPPRLLFLVTEDWYFWSHRLSLAEAAKAAGLTVSADLNYRKKLWSRQRAGAISPCSSRIGL